MKAERGREKSSMRKRVFHRNKLVNTAVQQRECTPVLIPKRTSLIAAYLAQWQTSREKQNGHSGPSASKMLAMIQAADLQGWMVGISFEPLPEIAFKVLRIRVKCQGGQSGDLFRLA